MTTHSYSTLISARTRKNFNNGCIEPLELMLNFFSAKVEKSCDSYKWIKKKAEYLFMIYEKRVIGRCYINPMKHAFFKLSALYENQ